MFSKRSQSLKVLMVLTVLMTVSQSEALNRLLKVLIVINVPSHSVDAPSPGFGVEITWHIYRNN